MSKIKLVLSPGRLAVSTVLASLTVVGWVVTTAVAADATSTGCPETSQQAPKAAVGDPAAGPLGDGQSTANQGGASGFRAYVDPETGELTEPPEDAAPEDPFAAAVSTSDEGLVEQPSPVPGGGVMVDLQGRFRSPLIATVGEGGKVKMEHVPCPGNSTQRK